jgi:DNA replication protein DnaC
MSRPPCEVCDDELWVEVTEGGVTALRRCGCFVKRIEQKRMRRINGRVPKTFYNVGFDRNPLARLPDSERRKLRSYHGKLAEHLDTGRGLWIDGESGTGKSAAAALLATEAERLGRTALYCEVPELLNTLRRTYADDSSFDDSAFYRDVYEVDLLVLDDLGAPRLNDWVLEQLFIFVNARYKNQRAIVVATDLSPDALARQINWRTVRRLHDICGEPLTLTFAESELTAA